MGLTKSSLSIVLNLYKKGKITEKEAVQLIEDISYPRTYYYPYYTTTTYNTEPQKYTVTCSAGTTEDTISETHVY